MSRMSSRARAKAVEEITRRMQSIAAPRLAVESFLRQYDQLVGGQTGFIGRRSIRAPRGLPDMDRLAAPGRAGKDAVHRAVIIKLNGGLGTSMGLDAAKSLLVVKDGLTFLDIVVRQVLHLRRETRCPLPLILMDSFVTHDDTVAALKQYREFESGQKGIPATFVQHRVPKIRQDNLMPADWPRDRRKEWCPPGHGDLYLALATSGTLARLLERGYEYAFVTNTDNLGATLDLRILGYFASARLPFLMEVTERTDADKKGGHLARSASGRLLLRERAQCPPDEEKDFQDTRRYRYFNTNNLWVNLRSLKAALEKRRFALDLPLIVNRKPADSSDPRSRPVYQLETAMGAAISVFPGAGALRVPRSRFAPVKTTEDLLALWSDAYVLKDDFHVALDPARKGVPPVLHLDPKHFGTYEDLRRRFAKGAPSLLRCESLTVAGDVRFGRNVTFRGRVRLENAGRKTMQVPDNAEIESRFSDKKPLTPAPSPSAGRG